MLSTNGEKVDIVFHDFQVRQKACEPNRDSPKLRDMITKYGVHHAGVGFSCRGKLRWSYTKPSSLTTLEAIQEIYGANVATIRLRVSRSALGFDASGWISDTQYQGEETVLLLFINDRLVESKAIKRSIKDAYANFLPKGHHPFVYLSLKVEPHSIDVNIHPRKLEVFLFQQDETIAQICEEIKTQLVASHLDCSNRCTSLSSTSWGNERPLCSEVPENNSIETILDRTDYPHIHRRNNASISRLRHLVGEGKDVKVTSVLSSSSHIHIIDPYRCIFALRSRSRTYLIAGDVLFQEAFYQIGLASFPNFGTLNYDPPLDICDLVSLAPEHKRTLHQQSPEDASSQDTPQAMTEDLLSKRAMLFQYFKIEISPDGKIAALPLLVKGYVPSLAGLPKFLRTLARCMNLEQHMCFETIFRELAVLHIPLEKNINMNLRSDNKTTNTSDAAGDAVSKGGILKADFLLRYVLKHIKSGKLVSTVQMVIGVDKVSIEPS